MAAMTGQERVNRMFAREDHDRVPRQDGYWRETRERWESEGMKKGEFLERLQPDFASCGGHSPVPYPGRRDVIAEDKETYTYTDEWGETVKHFKDKAGAPQHMGFICETREAWEQTVKPAYMAQPFTFDADKMKGNFASLREQGRWIFMVGLEVFEATRRLMGDETTLMAMCEDPEWVVDVSRTYTDLQLARMKTQLEVTGIKPDGMWMYGDMAYRAATVCSPAMYRELIWPDHKRLADFAHAHGMKFIFHTDGDVRGVIDLYIEAGFDCLQPLEAKANMDVRDLCPQYGQELAFFGNIDMMVLGSGDRDAIRHEVVTKLEAGKVWKGYAYHSDHSVPPTVSWADYSYLMDLLDEHGNY